MIFQNYISKILRKSYLIFIRINQNRKYIRNIPLNFPRRKPSNVSVSIFYLAKIPPSKTMKQWKLFETSSFQTITLFHKQEIPLLTHGQFIHRVPNRGCTWLVSSLFPLAKDI